jgi:hypothetical protein
MNWLKKLINKKIISNDIKLEPNLAIMDSSLYKVDIKKVTIKNIRINK